VLILALTTDKLQVTTSAAVTTDVHASFVDVIVGTSSTPGKQNTAITTATTTDIVAVPGGSTQRVVKHINIRNKHATSPQDVTVIYDANGTDYELHKATLLAGEVLEYQEGIGWFVVQTVRKESYYRRVTSDYVNATTSGPRFAINGPAMTGLRLGAIIMESGGVAAAVMNGNVGDVTALDTAVAATTDSTTTMVMSIMSGWFNPSASGTFAVRACSEVAVAAGITIKAGSFLRVFECDN